MLLPSPFDVRVVVRGFVGRLILSLVLERRVEFGGVRDMTFERDEARGFRAADADVLVEKQNARAERAVEQPAAYVLEVRPKA